MKIRRHFTQANVSPYDTVTYERRTSSLRNPDGSTLLKIQNVEVPSGWSQVATDILAQKYFRRTGVPQTDAITGLPLTDDKGQPILGGETSVKQVVHRLAGCWRHWGEGHGYFDTEEDGQAFYDELAYMLLHQNAAPNSPQWFNTGLAWAYGITGSAQGHFYVDPDTEELRRSDDAYTRPQPHACFIQSVKDDLVNDGGIMDLWMREARVFKYGSGTGTNFSSIRAEDEPLSGGGKSSGLMSFLKIGDRAAGAIKSGGTTRRAAKMVCLDVEHPDIMAFINWKMDEEKKVKALGDAGYSIDFNGDAYATVSGQNSNNSVRVSQAFLEAVEKDAAWETKWRTTGGVARTLKSTDVWDAINKAAWACADPGLQYDTTINDWHTCPADGRINASNPCVTGDTMVATAHGWQSIKSLADAGAPVTIVNGNGENVTVQTPFKTGHKPVVKINTSWGIELRLTSDHKVWTRNRGDVPAGQLTHRDELLIEAAGFGSTHLPGVVAERMGRTMARALAIAPAAALVREAAPASTDPSTPHDCCLTLGEHGMALSPSVFALDRASTMALLKGWLATAGQWTTDAHGRGQLVASLSAPQAARQFHLLWLSLGLPCERIADNKNGDLLVWRGDALAALRAETDLIAGAPWTPYLTEFAEPGTRPQWPLIDRMVTRQELGSEDVYDLTEPRSNHFVANGLIVHNCSEYMFLDDTACNLASVNLLTFYDPATRKFDLPAYEHACRLWTMVLEISVLMAQFPSPAIAWKSYEFRTLGLGYANLGALLMTAGLPYDSDEGRAWAGALTAIMTGVSYATSAQMAKGLGPFPGYQRNRDAMLRVIRNHRRAAYNADTSEFEALSIAPMGIDPRHTPTDLLEAARKAWDEALALGEKYGYRNAQTTVIAPTGTIGLLMDCVAGDTVVVTDIGTYTIADLCDYAVTGGVQVVHVLGIDPETREIGWYPLNLAWAKPSARELLEIELEDGSTLRCTPDHRVLTVGGWMRAADLAEGVEVETVGSAAESITQTQPALFV